MNCLEKERIKVITHTDIFLVNHLPTHGVTRIQGCSASPKINLKKCILDAIPHFGNKNNVI